MTHLFNFVKIELMQNIIEFYQKFSTEQSCMDYLENMRWHGSPRCPRCSANNVSKFQSGKLWKCNTCKKQFTVRIGTIFEESRIPLQKWFLAIFLATSLKKGISSLQLSKYLGVTQKTSWFMLQRIRFAIESKKDKFTGTSEVDETYFGGKSKTTKTRGRNFNSKSIIVGIVNRDTKEIQAKVIRRSDSENLHKFVDENADTISTIMTDEWRSYNNLDKKGFKHMKINHSLGEYVNGMIHTNTIEGFWSHLKRGIKGIQHQVSKKHLVMYLNEYIYRYNTRAMHDVERFNDWFGMIANKRLTYLDLINL